MRSAFAYITNWSCLEGKVLTVFSDFTQTEPPTHLF